MNDLELPPSEFGASATNDHCQVDPHTSARLRAVAREFTGSLLTINIYSPDADRALRQITSIGSEEVRRLSEQAGLMLSRSDQREQAVAKIHEGLGALRAVLQRLMPRDTLLKSRRLLGLIARPDALTSYFSQYSVAEPAIESALSKLAASRDLLIRDSVTTSASIAETRRLLLELAEATELCANFEERLVKLSYQIETSDPDRACWMRSRVLSEVRQRHADLLTQTAVSRHGYVTLGMVESNNFGLIRGIDGASSSTIAALRTAVAAARTLANQNLVLDRIRVMRSGASASMQSAHLLDSRANDPTDRDGAEAAQQLATLRAAVAGVISVIDAHNGHQVDTPNAR